MINIGFDLTILLGLTYLLLAIVYFILILVALVQRRARLTGWVLLTYIIQAIFIPVLLLICGLILIFQGWRLDPVLQLEQFLLAVIIFYLIIKDVLINSRGRNN